MTSAEEQNLVNLVRWRIREWRSDEYFEDILSEALIIAWQRYSGLIRDGIEPGRAMAMAVGCAKFGRTAWFRKWIGKAADGNSIAERPENLSLEEIDEQPAPSFEPAVLTRLQGQWLWRQAQQVCTPRQQQVLELLIWQGETAAEAGRQLGVARQGVKQCYDNAIRRCRELVAP